MSKLRNLSFSPSNCEKLTKLSQSLIVRAEANGGTEEAEQPSSPGDHLSKNVALLSEFCDLSD